MHMSGRVKLKGFNFKDIQGHIYRQIHKLNTEEKVLEISKMWHWIVQNATLMSFKQLCQIWTCKINSTKCPFIKCQIENIQNLRNFKYFFTIKDISGLQFLFSNSSTFKDFQDLYKPCNNTIQCTVNCRNGQIPHQPIRLLWQRLLCHHLDWKAGMSSMLEKWL